MIEKINSLASSFKSKKASLSEEEETFLLVEGIRQLCDLAYRKLPNQAIMEKFPELQRIYQ